MRLAVTTLAFIAASCLLLPVVEPDGPAGDYVGIGFLLGTLFGQTNVAAAWVALGPGPLNWRLPLSLMWVGLLVACLAMNVAIHGGPNSAVFELGACFLGQWLIVQFPLWTLALGYGLRLRHCDDRRAGAAPQERQFGLRQLMVFTAVVGVILGVGRAIVIAFVPARAGISGDTYIFIFLAVAAVVMSLPLVIASLLPRLALVATVAGLALMALATFWELPLLNQLKGAGGGPDTLHLVWINLFTAAWVLAFTVIARLHGYHLRAARLLE
jgi:hypothetical protein